MMKLFVKYVIGGDSGKREAAWALAIVWILGVLLAVVTKDTFMQELCKATILPVWGFVAAAHGLEHMQPKSKGPIVTDLPNPISGGFEAG